MSKFSVVGIGPGSADYILPIARKVIGESDLIIGGRRQLSHFHFLYKEEILLAGNYRDILPVIRKEKEHRKIALLVSGDPGYHSLLGMISREFSPEEYEVIPGVSSFQLAFCRIGLPWQDAELISLHGGNLAAKDFPRDRTFAMLTDRNNTPGLIALHLSELGMGDRRAYLAEDLSYESERIRTLQVKDINEEEYRLCVMIVQ